MSLRNMRNSKCDASLQELLAQFGGISVGSVPKAILPSMFMINWEFDVWYILFRHAKVPLYERS